MSAPSLTAEHTTPAQNCVLDTRKIDRRWRFLAEVSKGLRPSLCGLLRRWALRDGATASEVVNTLIERLKVDLEADPETDSGIDPARRQSLAHLLMLLQLKRVAAVTLVNALHGGEVLL